MIVIPLQVLFSAMLVLHLWGTGMTHDGSHEVWDGPVVPWDVGTSTTDGPPSCPPSSRGVRGSWRRSEAFSHQPIMWSIRNLRAASQTDGKAAVNLSKLRLFREFYLLVVAYIYFRVIVLYLVALSLPYAFTWMEPMFDELAALIFYGVATYKFRPTKDNPYLSLKYTEEMMAQPTVIATADERSEAVVVYDSSGDVEMQLSH
eukprot:TRINITY_DN656_c0_g1_i1.p1 TRINITY_DN656_c0_g1~~TRINITY_DN656_c0_g1_i1.p1  ORF type:complete len:203 (-),score=37.07 TRINITY_DN656_c0_g1_i1:53-661(-)